ncbi:MAG: MerR family DNA-binding protein [Sulfuricaulis sp.]
MRFRNTPEQNCGEVNVLLDEHIEHVGERIAELTRLENQLKGLRRSCGEARATKHCRIQKKLSYAQPVCAGTNEDRSCAGRAAQEVGDHQERGVITDSRTKSSAVETSWPGGRT